MTEVKSTPVDTVNTFFNNPKFSDALLVFNNENYYVATDLLKQSAPLLFKEFEMVSDTLNVSQIEGDNHEQIVANLTLLFSKMNKKKTLTMEDLRISKETVTMVLEYVYGKQITITQLNLGEVYALSTKFGMEKLVAECKKVFTSTITVDTLIEDYLKAVSNNSPLVSMCKIVLMKNLGKLPKDKVLKFCSSLSYDFLLEFLEDENLRCTEDLRYEIIEEWTKGENFTSSHHLPILMTHINLSYLSIQTLVTKAKFNPFIDHGEYTKIVEQMALKYAPNFSSIELKNNTSNTDYNGFIFAIGRLHGTYPNYRLLTGSEIEKSTFTQLFAAEYNRLNGIYVLYTHKADIICCEGWSLAIRPSNLWIRLGNKDCLKGSIVELSASTSHGIMQLNKDEVRHKISTLHVSSAPAISMYDTTGLFVLNNLTF